jgi:hypothetical protein
LSISIWWCTTQRHHNAYSYTRTHTHKFTVELADGGGVGSGLLAAVDTVDAVLLDVADDTLVLDTLLARPVVVRGESATPPPAEGRDVAAAMGSVLAGATGVESASLPADAVRAGAGTLALSDDGLVGLSGFAITVVADDIGIADSDSSSSALVGGR